MANVQLSVNTFYYRYLNPLLILVSIVAIIFLAPRKNITSIVIFSGSFAVSIIFLLEKRKVLSVQFSNNNLIISNYFKKDIVPIEKVNHVIIEGSGLTQKGIIEFKEKSKFGSRIYFSPKDEITTANQENNLYKKVLKIDEYKSCD